MARLCGRALAAGIEVEYVRDLIRRRNLSPGENDSHGADWPRPVEIRTLGRFEVIREGIPLRFAGKVPKKPMEMLKVCIARGGSGVNWTEISDILWPDAEGDAAYKSFGVTLIRLRKLIGRKEAVRLHEGRVTLDPAICRVDVMVFRDLLAKADARIGAGETEAALPLIEEAMRLYGGDFLPGEEQSWARNIRERLGSSFRRYALILGSYREKAEEWQKAAACYGMVLEQGDPENIFRRKLDRCLRRLEEG